MTDIGPKALREMCEQILARFNDLSAHKCAMQSDYDAADVARWALDRLSGEAVTPEQIAAVVCKHVPPTRICDQGRSCQCWEEYAMPAARAIAALLPAGMDRNAVVEECAKIADDYSALKFTSTDQFLADREFETASRIHSQARASAVLSMSIRALKSS